MNKSLWIAVILLLGSALGPAASVAADVEVLHEEPLHNVSFGRAQSGWPGVSDETGPVRVAFDALGRRFALELEANNRLLGHALREQVPTGIGVYRGRLSGRPDSWVRLVVADGVPSGLIWDGEQMHAIEARSGTSGARSAVIFRLQDVYVEPGTMTCGSGGGPVASFATIYEDLEAELTDAIAQAPGAVEELTVGLVADYELTQSLGAATRAEILTRINNVDGIFSEQLGVQLRATEIETFIDPNDPFTSSVPGELLVEASDYRRFTSAQAGQGITFLFTGRDLDGSTVGIAYRGALCSTRYGVGLGEVRRTVTTDSLIAAHEIGHIFGAEHDGEAGSVCEAETGTFVMSPRVSGTDQFSNCSKDTMRPYINGASCINPLPEADVAVAYAGSALNLLLGDSLALDFDISNNGSLEATNVSASFDIPANLGLGLVSTTAGSCSSGAGQVNCTVGTIAGSTSERVTFAVTADAVGSGTLSASVTADADVDPFNNSQNVPVSISPATDLVVRGSGSASVTVDNTVTIRPIVENVSTLGATNVALSISFSGGLRVDSASWPGGGCSITATSVDCQLASLAAQSQVTVDIQLTATAVGSQSYSASVSLSEVDRNTNNNSATGIVTVTSPGGSNNNDSGGGALSLFWLMLVAAIRRMGLARRPVIRPA